MKTLQREFDNPEFGRCVVTATEVELKIETAKGCATHPTKGRSEESIKEIFDSQLPEALMLHDWKTVTDIMCKIDHIEKA